MISVFLLFFLSFLPSFQFNDSILFLSFFLSFYMMFLSFLSFSCPFWVCCPTFISDLKEQQGRARVVKGTDDYLLPLDNWLIFVYKIFLVACMQLYTVFVHRSVCWLASYLLIWHFLGGFCITALPQQHANVSAMYPNLFSSNGPIKNKMKRL